MLVGAEVEIDEGVMLEEEEEEGMGMEVEEEEEEEAVDE